LGFLITAGGLFSFSTKPASENLNRSNFSATLGYGTNGAVIGCSLWNTYWLHDRIRVNLELWFKDMSDHYWGVGYENARNTPKGDSTTAYQRLWWQIMPELHYQVYPDLYLGMKFDFNRTVFSDMSPGVANDPNVLNYDTDNFNSGVGLILMYDSRDMPENSYSGWLLRDSATIYDEVLGSNNAYQIFEVDYRQYQQILRPGSTLAWQVYSRIGTGQVPYAEVT
jgi:outer membrane protein assembly factor BamA